jgi:hypothetical protein
MFPPSVVQVDPPLPRQLVGPHADCEARGCEGCLRTGLACAAWLGQRYVDFVLDVDKPASLSLFDALVAGVSAVAATPGDVDIVEAACARIVVEDMWAVRALGCNPAI